MPGKNHLAEIQRFLDGIASINDQFANVNWERAYTFERVARTGDPRQSAQSHFEAMDCWPPVTWVVDLIPLPDWRSTVKRSAGTYFFFEPGVSSDTNPKWEMGGGSPPQDTRAPEDVDRFVQMLEQVFAVTAVRAWDVNLDRSSGSFATSTENTLLQCGDDLYLLSFAAGA
jgi:hypothetical protein